MAVVVAVVVVVGGGGGGVAVVVAVAVVVVVGYEVSLDFTGVRGKILRHSILFFAFLIFFRCYHV